MVMPGIGLTINNLSHPEYSANIADWTKWRDAYNGGRYFVDKYLRKFSLREDNADYLDRKFVTYCPRFAGAAVDEVKNSIYQRMADITRLNGSRSYNEAVEGMNRGVDLRGNSMNSFIGQKVLPELLTMRQVGVFVDMPKLNGVSIADAAKVRPYLYIYKVEDIVNWIYDEKNENQFEMVLLRDNVYTYDTKTKLPIGTETRYRHMWKDYVDNQPVVMVQIYDESGKESGIPITLEIPKIPFVVFEISNSLMEDIADYQIALMNLASSDIAFTLKANFPFYIEQFDPRTESSFIRYSPEPEYDANGNELPQGTQESSEKSADREMRVGVQTGRRYPKDMDPPSFIHPSPEPMQISMEKQEQLKQEIRLLLNLSLSNVKTVGMASAESKKEDNRTLESGLSNIGLTLEKGEREVAELWSMYEGNKEVATVRYPINYSLRSEEERRAEAKDLEDRMSALPSMTYQKAVGKQIARILLGHHESQEVMERINKEIDGSVNMVSDPEIVAIDVENGLCDPETASKLRGYPDGVAQKAEEAHARRLARIAEAQSIETNNASSRGVPDLDGNPTGGSRREKREAKDQTQNGEVKKKDRGPGKSLTKGSSNA